jgi:maleate isomerase
MKGRKRRIGFLVPPGNPTVEPEMMQLVPPGATLHFTRMVAYGETGSLDGQEERNRTQITHLHENVALLAMVKPDVVVLAHTATSYTLGKDGEAILIAELQQKFGIRLITVIGSLIHALGELGVERIAFGTPYREDATRKGAAHLESYGIRVVSHGRLKNVSNIYDESPERAYALGRQVDVDEAQAVFISGVGMPTIPILGRLEDDLGKPVMSAASVMMWNALRVAQVDYSFEGYGRLLTGRPASAEGNRSCP